MGTGSMSGEGVVIAGGGLAAQRCCETLRSRGFEGRIRMICEEPTAPYDRPPLSKSVLAGTRDPASLCFRPPGWYVDNAVEDTAHVIGEGPPDLIMAAAEACPSVAISVIDADGGEQVYP